MISPAWGPFLFDTSAQGWFARSRDSAAHAWMRSYLVNHQIHVSAATVMERVRGYALLALRAEKHQRQDIREMQVHYLRSLGTVWPIDTTVSVFAAEIMARLPQPPTPPRRVHKLAESRQERLARWRFDAIIAATALISRLTLVHNNASDFEAIREAVKSAPESFPALGPLQLIRCDSLLA